VFAGDSPSEQSTEEYYPELDRWLAIDVVDTADGSLVYVRDQTELHDHTQNIEQLEQRLERLESIDSVVATVLQKITDASARDEVWKTVCDRLGTTDLYEFVWIGERELTDDRFRIVTSAGKAPEMLEAISTELGTESPIPERIAVENKSTHVIQRIADEETLPRELRVAAFGRGLQSSIAIPIVYGESIYGVLSVYAVRKDGFSEQEIASLETLGELAGFAVNAIQQADLLFADTITELTISVQDDSIPFITAVEAADEPLVLDGVVAREDGTVVCYLRPMEATASIVETLNSHTDISTVRTIQEQEESPILEVGVSGSTPLAILANWGATITDAKYTSQSVELSADLPPDGDVKSAVTAVSAKFVETEVLSKETRQREPQTMEAFQNELTEALTEKQRKVLKTAHLADYFASPRGSTSEEVAEALDIAGPTVLYHLRNAQRKLLNAFFDDTATSTSND
jgi:predicted DNA binding protein